MTDPDSAIAPPNPELGHDDSKHFLPYAVLVFVLSVILAIEPSLPFFVVAFVYGVNSERIILQSSSAYLAWIRGGVMIALFFVFYLLGRRIDFGKHWASLAIISFAGMVLGGVPQLITIQTSALNSTIIGYGLSADSSMVVAIISSAFEDIAIPLAGLALAYFLGTRGFASIIESGEGRKKRIVAPRVLFVLGFVIPMLSYVAQGVVDVIGSRFPPRNDQFAFLRTLSVISPPYDSYAFDLFVPLLFFIAFYLFGRRLDTSGNGLKSFAVAVFAAGACGVLVGSPLEYYIRATAASPSHPFPPFSLGLAYFEGSISASIFLLVLGFAAASLGLLRSRTGPQNHDRWLATGIVVALFLVVAISFFVTSTVSSGSPTSITITTVSTTVSTTIAP